MKTTLTILLFFFTFCAKAQTFTIHQDSIFHYLDKSKITTGVLADRAYPWVNLTTIDYNDTFSTKKIKQIWHQLHTSTYANSSNLSIFDAENKSKGYKDTISIGYIHYKYNKESDSK